LSLDWYATFMLAICSRSEKWVAKLSPESIRQIDCDIWLTRCNFRYLKSITHCSTVFPRAPECCLPPNKPQTRSSEWRILSINGSVHSRWCHKSHSPAG
jgi:hypothetical protein